MGKSSFDIDKLTNKNDIANKIKNQINSLNKKIKSFNKNDITEHGEMINHLLGDGSVEFNDSGSIKKGMKFFKDKNILELKRTLSALHKMNNHELYGTVKKYEKEVNNRMYGVQQKVKEFLRKKGYNDNFINEVIHDKEFYAKLFTAFQSEGERAPSDSVIEKVALEYKPGESGLTDSEINKIFNNIENSANLDKSIEEENEAYSNFKKDMMRNKMRR